MAGKYWQWKKLSAGKKTAPVCIHTGPCYYFGFTAVANNESWRLTLYDNVANSGTVIEDYQTDAQKEMDGHSHAHPVVCSNGIYLDFANAANRSVVVYYLPQANGG